ncbi:MAG: NYN domain-containing protein [Fimbriimonadaceae bacterium]|nr:NYN domain-containing protein [Alphaproteobacteria bacterium]
MVAVRVFVDFWNFQLGWNSTFPVAKGTPPIKIDWKGLPTILMNELPAALGGVKDQLQFKGINVYASVNPDPNGKDVGLKTFLHKVLNQMVGYQVHVFNRMERRTTDEKGVPIIKTVEKGVDTRIVTDLFSGAINKTYDVALLVSNDSDFCPAIQTIQDRLDKQIIHVGFRRGGDEIRSMCWSHIVLDGSVGESIKVVS